MLEPDEAKVSSPVLRGLAPSNGGGLLGTRGDLFSRTPFRANVRIAEWAVRPLGVFGDMLMLERQWKTLKLRPWGEARYKTRLGNKERLCPKKIR